VGSSACVSNILKNMAQDSLRGCQSGAFSGWCVRRGIRGASSISMRAVWPNRVDHP